ncbi:nuclease [Alteromonas phage ZP6]|uniref:Endonuclease n=1 Tax=Alteromonas phage ZP6 TaxID=2492447 RepID=A0A3S9U8F4_9CAUD|nr:nuclease [Alteromonas phage ZP6]AZS06523.1 nuclease [Alteromonas phage ZP6]
MNETTFRKYLRDILVRHGAAVSQVESHETSAGIPDTSVCLSGIDSWIELKFATNKTRTRKKGVVVRKSQKVWFRDRLKAGAKNLFVGVRYETDGRTFNVIKHVSHKEELNNTNPVWWMENGDLMWENGDDPWYVEPLLQLLRGEK